MNKLEAVKANNCHRVTYENLLKLLNYRARPLQLPSVKMTGLPL
jgi:hypothetical protein